MLTTFQFDSRASDALRPAYEKSCKLLDDYLAGKVAGSDKIKVATVVANTMSKTMGAEANKATVHLIAQRLLTHNNTKLIDQK